MRRVATAALLTIGLAWPFAPAQADDTFVVPGTSFPSSSTYLSYFGCLDLFHADTTGPSTRVLRDPAAPLGRRAVEIALPGSGTAAGAISLVASVASATSTLEVRASAGSSGVAYVWYLAPDMAEGEVWSGRADLTAVADGWQHVDAAAATYAWTRVDAATGSVLESPDAATIVDFAAENGDGPGYLLAGLGCDGREFAVDAIRVGSPGSITTYDLEGWTVATSALASRSHVRRGKEVELSATTVDAGGANMGSALVLEARPAGADTFRPVSDPVLALPDGQVVTTVAPEVTTDYRWFFEERSYADAHWSPTVRVVVGQARR